MSPLCPQRVINAGKSALNEDQARCEVLVIKRKPGGNPTSCQIPMTRRRSSLPNGEGFDLHGSLVSEVTFILAYVAESLLNEIRIFLLCVPEVYSTVGNGQMFQGS